MDIPALRLYNQYVEQLNNTCFGSALCGSEGSSVRFRRNHHYCDWTVSISQNTCLSMSGMNILDMKVQPFNPVVGTGLFLHG